MAAQAAAPAFGQSSGFGSTASFGGTRLSNPFSTGNGGGSSSTTTTFGSSSGFGGQAGSLSSAPTTATTFGGAAGGSSVGRQFGNNRNDRAPPSAFGNRARNPSFDNSGGGAPAFGGGGFNGGAPRQQPPLPPPDAGGDGFGFGGMPSGVSTAFGQPAVRSKKTFPPRDPSASVATTFGNASGGFGVSPAPSPAPSPSTAFGTQSAGVRVRRKTISPAGGAGDVSAEDNPFGSGGGFGSAGGNASRPPFGGATDVTSHTAFGQPTRVSPGTNGATATAFGRERKEPATGGAAATNPFDGNNGTSFDGGGFGGLGAAGALEARLSGGLKKPMGKNKRLQNTPVGNNGNGNSGIEQSGMMPSKKFLPRNTINKSFAGDSDTDSGPFPPAKILAFATSRNNANLRKKNLRASAPDFIPTPSASPIGGSSNNNNQDDSSKAELSSAVNLDGTCVDMCSPAERELHIRVDELSVFEKCFPDQPGRESDLIIKRFQRSSADHKLDIPSEVRPPGVLRRTQLYIEQEIMDRERAGVDPRLNPPRVPDIIELYNFCWDRFRMIRKDFVLQNYRGAGGRVHPIALDVHERVARYHILSEHELIEVPSFVAQQNMEQLGQTLKSLNELYDESRNTGDPGYLSPFEAEFRAYFILCALDNGRGLDVLKFVKGLHKSVVDSPQVKFAMKVFVARHTNDYFQFFSLLRQATYLQSCLLFRYIPSIRSGALQRMNRAFRNQPYPLVDLMELLCFDDLEHAGSVCQQHGLDITQPNEDDSDGESIMVQFGGDFETDIQLRKDKKPLEVRSSHVFVGQKQGEYLRKDICRGVTEYYPEEYPPLSHLIQDLETKERARLYPSRPVYEDEYSSFANYSSHASQLQSYSSTQQQQLPPIQPARAAQPAHSAPSAPLGFQTSGTDQQFGTQDNKMLGLDAIARRKAELEYRQHMAMQHIEQLQRVKEEKARLENERKAGVVVSVAASPSDEIALKVAAEAKAQKEAEDKARSLRLQQKLEDEVRAQEKELQLRKQRELEEMEKRRKEAAAAAEAARQEREAELRRQAKAAEEERKRCEAERLAEEARRKAAEEIERRRQEQLAEEQARLRREAALEAKRQEQLALERAEKKRQLRIKKQIQARLKLRFHMWMKYVKASKALPPPVKIDASRFVGGMVMNQYKPKNTIQWLFKDETAASQVGTRLRNPSELIKIQNAEAANKAPVPDSSWSSLDVLSLVGPQLRNKHSFADSSSTISWKLVVGDLVDDQTSSFGVWCASKLGISGNSAPFQIFHSLPRDFNDDDVAVCCRYIDAASLDNFSGQEQQKSTLSGVSALLLSVPLSEVLDTGKRQRWLQRVEKLFASLPKQSQVVVSILLFVNVDPSAKTRHTVGVLETSIRQLHAKFAQVVDVGFTLVSRSKNESLADQLAQAVVSLSKRCVPPPKSASIGLKELLEESVSSAMKRCASSSANKIQEVARSSIRKVYEELRSQQLQPGGYAGFIIPELQNATSKPEVDESDQWQAIESVLVTLASQRIEDLASQAPLQRDGVCNRFFTKIAEFIDRIFSSASRGPILSEVSTFELKKLVFNLLVPVHDQLANEPASQPIAADAAAARLPWKQIFLEIYGAFFESLGDLNVTVSTIWRSQHTQELLAMESASMGETRQSSSTQPLGALVTNGFGKAVAPPAPAPAPVAPVVSLNSLKRSFGVALGSSVLSSSSLSTTITSSSSKQRYEHKTRLSHQATKEDPRLRRLHQEIAREKAASASFQQLLRREVNRWGLADPASF